MIIRTFASLAIYLFLSHATKKSLAADLVARAHPGQILNKNSTTNLESTVTSGTVSATTQRPQGIRLPCSCAQGQCGCCTGMILERFRQKACMNITYEPEDFAFTAALNLNGKELYKNTVSGKNPPPICIRMPRFRFVQLCVEFSNIYFANRNMHVCMGMEANWESFTLLDLSFNCIRMGINGLAVLGPEDGGGLPSSSIDQEEQVDEDYDDSARDSQLLGREGGVATIPGRGSSKPDRNTALGPKLRPTFVNATKSNYLKYANSKNSSEETGSDYDMKNVFTPDVVEVPPSVKRLSSGYFLITFDKNSTTS